MRGKRIQEPGAGKRTNPFIVQQEEKEIKIIGRWSHLNEVSASDQLETPDACDYRFAFASTQFNGKGGALSGAAAGGDETVVLVDDLLHDA